MNDYQHLFITGNSGSIGEIDLPSENNLEPMVLPLTNDSVEDNNSQIGHLK